MDKPEQITKREHFAIMALQGLLASGFHITELYEYAVHSADKLLEELEKVKDE
jgi:hypothetical protein